MADKTTTLKTQTGDNVYPNVLDKNIPDSIVRGVELNAVQENLNNKIAEIANGLKGEIDTKQNTLKAGNNITIIGDTISATSTQTRYYSHFIYISSSIGGSINFNYTNTSADELTISTLKSALKGKKVTCSGFFDVDGTNEIATYIAGEAGGLSVGWYDLSDGSSGGITIDDTFSISDEVTPVE